MILRQQRGGRVVAVGNAIYDVYAAVDEAFLSAQGFAKGSMQWVSAQRSRQLLEQLVPLYKGAGGSGANTMVGLSKLGGKASFLGLVNKDAEGDAFCHSLRSARVDFVGQQRDTFEPTALCTVMVAPDSERTMATYLGASVQMGPEHITEKVIAHADIICLEAYSFEPEGTYHAMCAAATFARTHNTAIAFALADMMCVNRHKAAIHQFINEGVTLLIGNAQEAQALTGETDVAEAVKALSFLAPWVAITCGASGSFVAYKGTIAYHPPVDCGPAIDTTGAGDQYFAGFLYGLTQGLPVDVCAGIASLCGGEAVTHLGAHPATDLTARIESLWASQLPLFKAS